MLTWDTDANTVQIGAVICGNDFVGGLVGCNDATAKITNTSTLAADRKRRGRGRQGGRRYDRPEPCPGPARGDIKVTEISGTLCVGGVIGANMPVAAAGGDAFTIKETATSGGDRRRFTTTARRSTSRPTVWRAASSAYNCLLASTPDDLTTILPTVAEKTGLVTVNNTLPCAIRPIP